jgi:hypothetical protein
MGFLERADVYNEAIRAFTRSVGQTEARSTVLAASSGGQTTPRQVN